MVDAVRIAGGWENSLAFSFPEPLTAKRRHNALRYVERSEGSPRAWAWRALLSSSDLQAPMPPGQRA